MKQNLFLDFKNVEIKQQNKIILNDVNLKINQGEFVYFVGKTGSGKSSLLKAIYGDVGINNGDILFKDLNLKKFAGSHPSDSSSKELTWDSKLRQRMSRTTVSCFWISPTLKWECKSTG